MACNQKPASSTVILPTVPSAATGLPTIESPDLTPTALPVPIPTRLLRICLGREPVSLFYYDATSTSARDILAAVYDGPVDIRDYAAYPVILEKMPSLKDGDALLRPVEVKAGDLIVDGIGSLVSLEAGVNYRPSGCSEISCTLSYSGDSAVQIDQWVVNYKLLPGIQWSDGTALTAADSVYSFEIARSLNSTALADVVQRTQSYRATDDTSIEWVGLPGYQDGSYQTKFFTPLPQHAWHTYSVDELRTADAASRQPLGWGAYVIDEWVAGDHISLHKNPLYFRAGENLPHFDNLVFRFVGSTDEALDALQAGECDLIDQTAMLDTQPSRLADLEKAGQAATFYQYDAGWEQITFGIDPLDPQRVKFFALKDVRQAIAMCIDRQALVADQTPGTLLLTNSYVPATHPLYNPAVQTYALDVLKASALLESAGWLDTDNNPATPRMASGVSGVPDGTPFEVEYLVSTDTRPQADAQAIHDMLMQCGIQTKIVAQTPALTLAPGPDGPVFGRSFDMAQFAWTAALEPPCSLYLGSEVPGPYPDFTKGWGGVNASGFSNPQYDQACENALFSLPDIPQHSAEHFRAQQIFSEQLPALPLYLHFSVSVTRPDLCNYASTSALDSPLWNLETLDDGNGCLQ